MLSVATSENKRSWNRGAAAEVVLIGLLFFLFAGWAAPDVNEAHYLTKAKHYWNPSWCAGDHFLESADAHLVYYWTVGWLTLLCPLPVVAWLGRGLTWTLLAWAWQRLSYAVVPRRWLALVSACLFLLFSQRFHMAGEWVVGGLEAKGFAYAFVLFALESLLKQRWRRAWIWLGVATAFHVLVGGWAFVAAGCAWLSCRPYRPPLRRQAPAMLIGLVLALPGLLPGLTLNYGISSDIIQEANLDYVYGRLAHHLLFYTFPPWFMARQALLLVVWLAACLAVPCQLSAGNLGQRPLRGFMGGVVAIALAGICIDQSLLNYPELAAALLRYYWFRLADAMLPVAAALALLHLFESWRSRFPRAAVGAWTLAICLAGGNLLLTNLQRRADLRPGGDLQSLPSWPDDPVRTRQTYEEWRHVCRWINEHTEPSARFITPRAQQTFKWYAERSEVCSWKDVPQDAVGLVEWWQRQQELYPRGPGGLAGLGEERLQDLARKYGAQYILVDRCLGYRPLLLPRVYPSRFDDPRAAYEVYRIPDR